MKSVMLGYEKRISYFCQLKSTVVVQIWYFNSVKDAALFLIEESFGEYQKNEKNELQHNRFGYEIG